ncbi:hypothetical protein CHS0354_027389 [Potamilus streckersoni]|uniref:Aminopeptidase N n=1 Tax=Potamilus streckersoni TaxID=2493646 RepID=A0AAE0SQV8_9BIVA|nr:hypothetical protein CHS0354_027389 [Potamilus streckersoni]
MTKKSATKYLKDYTPYPWQILSADLDVKLDEASTQVKTVIRLKKKSTAESIYLNGKKLELHSLHLNGVPLTPAQYITDEDGLTIPCTAEDVVLETVCIIHPDKNTELQGLYVSDGILTTQCESEGFRSITYFPDRPDCTTVFSCRLTGDKDKYPVMLSNGNPVEASVNGNEHSVLWKDPFAKPSYLFALGCRKAEQHRNRHGFAIESLKKSMRWDEEVFGLEYDLDIYMIVAVDDFNFGAMENKGLNVFNSRFILADDELTTDAEKIRIEAIIAHEYFHNWTGNRVTLRNWFHLTLKEGLTVFRDQEFTQDVRLGSVKRIEDVQKLVTYQFPEDAGPLAHPPIPQSYVNMNNFYTVTVYEKGAEIVRMLQTILGRELFVTAVKDYIARHDGDCAAVEDFIAAMERASGKNLAQFLRWYYRPGTPHLNIITNYNTAVRTLTLTVVQTNPTSEKQGNSDPFMIPLHIGLIGKISRREITYQSAQQEQEGIFILTDKKNGTDTDRVE